MKERKIGEVFEVDGVKVQCVENKHKINCHDCFFYTLECPNTPCIDIKRKDKKNVIFKELKN